VTIGFGLAVFCTSALAQNAAKGTADHIKAVTSAVDSASIKANTATSKDWPTYGLDYAETRFSKLNQINTDNVKDLGLMWSYNLESIRGVEATPVVVDGIMYVTASWSVVHAVDARTGKRVFEIPDGRGGWSPLWLKGVNIGAALPGKHRRQSEAQVSALRLVQHRDSILIRRAREVPSPLVDSAQHHLPAIVLVRLLRQLLVVTNEPLDQVVLLGVIDRSREPVSVFRKTVDDLDVLIDRVLVLAQRVERANHPAAKPGHARSRLFTRKTGFPSLFEGFLV
jgi:hypothetical protein